MELTPAKPADIDWLTEMNARMVDDMGQKNWPRDRYRERFGSWIGGGHWHVDLFVENGDRVGYAVHQNRHDHFDTSQRVIHIRHFYVDRDHRRKGIGTAAFRALEEGRFNRRNAVTLDILPSNPAGLAFWQSLGFDTYYTTLRRTS